MGAVKEAIIFSGCAANYISPSDLGPLVMLKSDIYMQKALFLPPTNSKIFEKDGIHR